MMQYVGDIEMNEFIKQQSAMYYLRATPFTEHSEFNYNGELKEEFFFDNMFTRKGKCDEYFEKIRNSLEHNKHKTILLTGNQGCGKTTFVHYLNHVCDFCDFLYFDFDQNTSHPTLEEYIERLSSYLHSLINDPVNDRINVKFHELYTSDAKLMGQKMNAENKIGNFFRKFNEVFLIEDKQDINKDNFIIEINSLFFNQILCMIVVWHLAKVIVNQEPVRQMVFCLDNLDVLVNQSIIENFFKEYFLFIRNIDGFINGMKDDYVRSRHITYNQMFSFVVNCRQHTWARVKKHYPHDKPEIQVSVLQLDITDAFDKREIIAQRESYVEKNKKYFGNFVKELSTARSILNDLDYTEKNRHSIYDLFNDDYRQCVLTLESILDENPSLAQEYMSLKGRLPKKSQGLRGVIYRALFDRFKDEGLLADIGVLDAGVEYPLVSNARLVLNYLNYHTYRTKRCVPFARIVSDFTGIIDQDDIDNSLVAMFTQGYKGSWNELIAFDEIGKEEVDTCQDTDILITAAGHEYLDFVATHFEYFSARVAKGKYRAALFSDYNLKSFEHSEVPYEFNNVEYHFEYNFEATIFFVMKMVERCCGKMTLFYDEYMSDTYPNKVAYLNSHFVYGESNVLHGERIIHTHIRYIDNYRLYLLKRKSVVDPHKKISINEKLTNYIKDYIGIGERFPKVLTKKSEDKLFPAFKKRIKAIEDSGYSDFEPIDV